MQAFEWRIKGLQKASAETAGAVCTQLQNSETGLTPASLVEASRDENAPLHGEFEWRDDVAAEEYRKVQAAEIIRNLVITHESSGGYDRAFVITPDRKSRYVDIISAMNTEEWRKNLMRQAKNDMEAFRAKYRKLEELADVIAAMNNHAG